MPSAKTLIVVGLFFTLLYITPLASHAQIASPVLESCFQYYDYGKVQANISADKQSYITGESIHLKGRIINNNKFPIADTILYAQIRRINETSYSKNGHYLVDRVTLTDRLNLMSQESETVDVMLPLKSNYPKGSYQIQYYIFSRNGFHYGGRSFLEEDYAGTTNFTITEGAEPEVYFDIDNVRVKGSVYQLRGATAEFPTGKFSFNFGVVDSRQNKDSIPVLIKIYSFEDDLENNLIFQTTSTLQNDSVQFEADLAEPGAYVLIAEINTPSQTVLKYRFAATSENPNDLRMNDLGVSAFPATSNGRAWVCLHSPTYKNTVPTTVSLTLLDSSKRIVEQLSFTDSFGPEVLALSIPLTKLTTPNDFWVTGQFTDTVHNQVIQSVQIRYECNRFNNALTSLHITYDQKKPDVLTFEGKNMCGTTITDNVEMDIIRVSQNGTVLQEKTNVQGIPSVFYLENLQPGAYAVEAKAGTIVKRLDFVIPETVRIANIKVSPQTARRIYIIVLILILGMIPSFWYFRRKKGK